MNNKKEVGLFPLLPRELSTEITNYNAGFDALNRFLDMIESTPDASQRLQMVEEFKRLLVTEFLLFCERTEGTSEFRNLDQRMKRIHIQHDWNFAKQNEVNREQNQVHKPQLDAWQIRLIGLMKWFCVKESRENLDCMKHDLRCDYREMKKKGRGKLFCQMAMTSQLIFGVVAPMISNWLVHLVRPIRALLKR